MSAKKYSCDIRGDTSAIRCRRDGSDEPRPELNRYVFMKHLLVLVGLLFFLALSASAGEGDRWFEISGGDWRPSKTELKELKERIMTSVKNAAAVQRRELRPWKDYTFQYRGQKKNGKNLIAVNAFCSTGQNVEKEWVVVFDGGSCYFSVMYDPARKEFFELRINGEA